MGRHADLTRLWFGSIPNQISSQDCTVWRADVATFPVPQIAFGRCHRGRPRKRRLPGRRTPAGIHLPQECRHHGNSDSLVSIHERVVLRQALPKGGRFLKNVIVVTGPWPRQCRLKRVAGKDSQGAPEFGDQPGVDSDDFIDGWIKGHCASRRSNSGC